MKRKLGLWIVLCVLLLLNGCAESSLPAGEESGGVYRGAGLQEDISEEVQTFSGGAYAVLNGNIPLFTDEERKSTDAFEQYSELDELGSCGAAFANICRELMPTQEREPIGQIKPSGWQLVKYDFIDGNYLYNRCHLIGYQLAGENANEKNLITGTRFLNVSGMLPFENEVADYIRETDNHVLYRVTPVFEGDNLVASGVTMEAYSVEDMGEGVCFYVYAYNCQPGVEIDYAAGDSKLSSESLLSEESIISEESIFSSDSQLSNESLASEDGVSYILNTNTKKFHLPDCESVAEMSGKNKKEVTDSREEIINEGYSPCKRCKP